MRAAPTIRTFLDAPLGAYVRGDEWVCWCASPSLFGITFWGSPRLEDVEPALELLDLDAAPGIAAPYGVLSDGSCLTGVDPRVFELVATGVAKRLAHLNRRVRRHALVAPSGMIGAIVSGFFPLLGARHAWRSFQSVPSALDWLSPGAHAHVGPELARLVTSVRRQSPLLDALRDYLQRQGGAPRLEHAAARLGESSRSLQRRLAGLGTSFREELGRARIEAARALLLESDDKLEVVADRAGYSSASHLVAAFRSETGQTPLQFRLQQRSARPGSIAPSARARGPFPPLDD